MKENNIFPKHFNTNCLGAQISDEDLVVGIENSDLHIYVIYEN